MLTAQAVEKIFNKCLLKNEEVVDNKPVVPIIEVEGLVHTFGFSAERTPTFKDEIIKLLAELPDEFHEGQGDGWSFLNACNDKHGNQWGEHINMEQLVALGIAVGKVRYCLPRSMWSMLPGGVPMFTVLK